MIASKNEKKRPAFQTTVHVSFAPEILERIDKLARAEDRTRINMVQVLVKRGLDADKFVTA